MITPRTISFDEVGSVKLDPGYRVVVGPNCAVVVAMPRLTKSQIIARLTA